MFAAALLTRAASRYADCANPAARANLKFMEFFVCSSLRIGLELRHVLELVTSACAGLLTMAAAGIVDLETSGHVSVAAAKRCIARRSTSSARFTFALPERAVTQVMTDPSDYATILDGIVSNVKWGPFKGNERPNSGVLPQRKQQHAGSNHCWKNRQAGDRYD